MPHTAASAMDHAS